jgi:hypothetical protein
VTQTSRDGDGFPLGHLDPEFADYYDDTPVSAPPHER